ncbi:6-phosphofructo-2-kinase/fructose-2,6-bisphosphatase 1-like isoform X2 [Toxorhynchites rutilus septentrionalis]|uniref:6-phosphofructo-2-kinase/fructose-2, 6-bisphosphatase 1-like isoform X2 n=1 Tax=Toxorhynchites rutilus septentrionalis TaxID=329112 RepID=UPI002478CD54|nr:6-phosphofructo-2-kinase/fructose-2,6-bisphosphatase 1-like isoform X2 [Toxorhynchites rutilus septentrionalis]
MNCLDTHAVSSSERADVAANGNGRRSRTAVKPDCGVKPCPLRAPLVVTVVGLPCRGKSLASHKVARHLSWRGESAKVYNVEENATADTLQEISLFFQEGNNVAIIDGMHLTRQSRQFLAAFCCEKVFHHLLIEFSCNEKCLQENIDDTVRFYHKLDQNIDWERRIKESNELFTPRFESCCPLEGPLITVNNSEDAMCHSVTARGVRGAIQTEILGVLASPVIRQQTFYFSRHGESEYNVLGRIGGDSDLSPRGMKYAERLARQLGGPGATPDGPKPKLIWTSELCRTIRTVQNIPGPRAAIKDLNEIDAGICEGLTYEEIQERFPQEFAWRDQDKFKYRYPHGESYLDLLQRVDSVVQALLANTDVLVVSHQAVLRCIMAYFTGSKPDDVPYINVPLHTLLIVRSYGYDFEVETVPLKVECVDTYRIQPKNCSTTRTSADALTTVPAHFDAPLSQQMSTTIS